MKGKLLSLVTCLFVLAMFTFNTPVVGAEQIDDEKTFYSPEFGGHVVAFKQNESGGIQVLNEDEHNTLINSLDENTVVLDDKLTNDLVLDEPDSMIMPLGSFREYDKFIHTSSTNFTGSPLKVTNDIGCTTSTCSSGYGVTYTRTVSYSYSAATASEKSAIKSTLGITLSSAKAETSSFTFNLKKGEAGYIAFKPYMVKKSGYFQRCANQGMGCRKTNKTGHVNMARKLSNGKADGMFYFVYTKKK